MAHNLLMPFRSNVLVEPGLSAYTNATMTPPQRHHDATTTPPWRHYATTMAPLRRHHDAPICKISITFY